MPNIFERADADVFIARINRLSTATPAQWGKMNVAQMLAHCSRPWDTVFDPAYARAHPKPNAVVRWLLRQFLKPIVVGPKPYARNSRTAPEFIVSDARDLEVERRRIIDYINRTQSLGAAHFEGKESHSFGPLTAAEWSMLFGKHLDHHLVQFGV
jgi:hypothetical protein